MPTVAIIMDGNRRWETENISRGQSGHEQGADVALNIINYCADRDDIDSLFLFAFSSDNWSRSVDEIDGIYVVIREFIANLPTHLENNIHVEIIGNTCNFPSDIRDMIESRKKESLTESRLSVYVAMDYTGRNDIVYATQKICDRVLAGTLTLDEINPETFAQHLLSSNVPDIDFVIRTGGEMRLSNFTLWQCAYSEFFFVPSYGRILPFNILKVQCYNFIVDIDVLVPDSSSDLVKYE